MDSLLEVLTELSSSLTTHWSEYMPWFFFYCTLHVIFEYGFPFISPGIYDSLAKRDIRKASEGGRKAAVPLDRVRLARQARTSLTSVIMAIHVTSVSLYALTLSKSMQEMGDTNLYNSIPLTRHLIAVSVGFFIWDLSIVLLDGMATEYIIHAVACLIVFVAAQKPFLHSMSAVVLLFEASTPFLKLREALLGMDETEGFLFKINNLAFSLTFFIVRIVFGYYKCFWFFIQINALVANGLAHSIPIARMYQVLAGGLTILNTIWMWRIIKGAIRNEGASPRSSASSASASSSKIE